MTYPCPFEIKTIDEFFIDIINPDNLYEIDKHTQFYIVREDIYLMNNAHDGTSFLFYFTLGLDYFNELHIIDIFGEYSDNNQKKLKHHRLNSGSLKEVLDNRFLFFGHANADQSTQELKNLASWISANRLDNQLEEKSQNKSKVKI